MPQKPQQIINDDGVDFAKYNQSIAKEKKAKTSKASDINFDYNALKNLKR